MRALMNAWYEANDSLTGGSSAASVASSAARSTLLACGGVDLLERVRWLALGRLAAVLEQLVHAAR